MELANIKQKKNIFSQKRKRNIKYIITGANSSLIPPYCTINVGNCGTWNGMIVYVWMAHSSIPPELLSPIFRWFSLTWVVNGWFFPPKYGNPILGTLSHSWLMDGFLLNMVIMFEKNKIAHSFGNVYTTYLWWNWAWFIIGLPTLIPLIVNHIPYYHSYALIMIVFPMWSLNINNITD